MFAELGQIVDVDLFLFGHDHDPLDDILQLSAAKLTAEIVARSVSDNWDAARLEWSLVGGTEADAPERCPCGHYPIIELCEIRNQKNRVEATVGNCCVKKFLGIRSDKIFIAYKKVRKDVEKLSIPKLSSSRLS